MIIRIILFSIISLFAVHSAWGLVPQTNQTRNSSAPAIVLYERMTALELKSGADLRRYCEHGTSQVSYRAMKAPNVLSLHAVAKQYCNRKSKNIEIFEALRRKHGDTLTANQRCWWGFFYWTQNKKGYDDEYDDGEVVIVENDRINIADDFVRIDVTSDADWDVEHPAGTLLNDLMIMEGITRYSYVRGDREGVKRTIDMCGKMKYFNPIPCSDFDFYRKPLPEVTSEDMTLMGRVLDLFGFLEFVMPPSLASEHRITVIMETDEGRIFTASKSMRFPVRASERYGSADSGGGPAASNAPEVSDAMEASESRR